MDTPNVEHILPVPDEIQIYDKDRRKMDDYVESFPATQHGCCIRIGRSYDTSAVSHYECYRSGFPGGKKGNQATTKSARIGCLFKLSTQYLYADKCWILIHYHLGHNHPPDPHVKPRKKFKDPKAQPILAPGVNLDDDVDAGVDADNPTSEDDTPQYPDTQIKKSQFNKCAPATSHNLSESNRLLTPSDHNPRPTPPPPTHDSFQASHDDIKATSISVDSLASTMFKFTDQLRSMTPLRRQEALMKISAIFDEEGTPPLSLMPAPDPVSVS